jgi:hypothetical protein
MYLTNLNPNGNIKFGIGGVHGTASEKMTLTSSGNLELNGNIRTDHLKLGEYRNVGGNWVRYFKIGYFTLPNQYMNGQAIVEVLTRHGGNHTVHVNIERGSNHIATIREFFVKGSTHAETYYLYRTSANVAELWVKCNQAQDKLQIGVRNHSSDFTPDVSSGQANAPASEASWSPDSYIFKNGNLGIGTVPSARLDVNGDIIIGANDYIKASNSWLRNNSSSLVLSNQGSGSMFFRPNGDGNGSGEMKLFQSGNLEVKGDVEAFVSSDKRLKTNIKSIDKPIDKISKIGGYTYEWNDKSDKETGKKDIGVIAQEIEKVLPELVQTRENGYKAVKYDKIVALLVEGIKEQDKKITDLQSQINEIYKRI